MSLLYLLQIRFKLLFKNSVDTLSIQVRTLTTLLPILIMTIVGTSQNDKTSFVLVSFLLTLFIGNNVIMCSIYAMEEKRMGRGSYYQVMGISPNRIILGNMIPWIMISFFSNILAFSISSYFFHISVLSSKLFEMILIILILTIQSYCIGFVVAYFAVKRNNIKTTFYMFSIIQFFSGYIYPVDYIPIPLRYLVYTNPFFYGIDGFRQLLHLDYFLNISFQSKMGLIFLMTVLLLVGVKVISAMSWQWDNA
ncbi:ABC transporter permease [Pseudolactococcus reticulitermitis]|uniref:Transport permease protein n=1 Tax=Pseudolactococcus reticulitermitis TaxID=2025039 RepID=A0A224X904_9LACT|nr:ABC transporter permease [Lactococcus reticulitermitis]GAX47750.1 hypothetical protein RsY01_1352 [Lactococcus reticulitermitis]